MWDQSEILRVERSVAVRTGLWSWFGSDVKIWSGCGLFESDDLFVQRRRCRAGLKISDGWELGRNLGVGHWRQDLNNLLSWCGCGFLGSDFRKSLADDCLLNLWSCCGTSSADRDDFVAGIGHSWSRRRFGNCFNCGKNGFRRGQRCDQCVNLEWFEACNLLSWHNWLCGADEVGRMDDLHRKPAQNQGSNHLFFPRNCLARKFTVGFVLKNFRLFVRFWGF